ncbi:hypothetical protein HKL94_00995 [Candidatus Parcubacteria bacterium]|nr:hypothetical protein [Candidatus Parcubacteria bacterium]
MQKHSEDCSVCHGYGMRGGMCRHHFGHILIKLLIAVFIFWCGVQFGELEGILHDGYGNFRMMDSNGWSTQGYGGPAMMYGDTYGSAPQTYGPASQTVSPTTTTGK